MPGFIWICLWIMGRRFIFDRDPNKFHKKSGTVTRYRRMYLRILFLILFYTLYLGLKTGIAQDMRITAVVPENFPPQYFLDENGQPTGFAIDIMNEIADLAKSQINYVVVDSWHDVNKKIKNNEVDLIPNMGINEQRKPLWILPNRLKLSRYPFLYVKRHMKLTVMMILMEKPLPSLKPMWQSNYLRNVIEKWLGKT